MYKMQELKSLITARSESGGTSLVTYLIPPKSNLNDVRDHLMQESKLATNIKSKDVRLSVIDALKGVMYHLKSVNFLPDNGLCIYSGRVINEHV